MATGVQELKLAARMQEWSVRIAECRSSGMGVKGVVQITGNRSHDLLPLGEAIHHRSNPATQRPGSHASRDAHADHPGCSADWGYGHLFDALIWAVIPLSVLYALYRGFIHSLLSQAARSGSCVYRHGAV